MRTFDQASITELANALNAHLDYAAVCAVFGKRSAARKHNAYAVQCSAALIAATPVDSGIADMSADELLAELLA